MSYREIAERAVTDWHAQQKPEELAALGYLIRRFAYRHAVEVGTYSGGTAMFFAQLGLEVVAIDRDLTHVECRVPRIRYVEGDSVEMAATVIDGAADVVFIDGDHSLEAVTADWEAYWPKVRVGGILAFHDIRHHAGQWGGHSEVEHLWARITASPLKTQEFLHDDDDDNAGIGVVLKEEPCASC